MSPNYFILGLPDLVVDRVDRQRDIHVWAKPVTRLACPACQHSPVRIMATYERTVKHTGQGNQLMVLHLRAPKYHCPQCNSYFRHPFRCLRPPLRATDAFRLEVFEAHDQGVSQRKLASTHRISCATVERWNLHQIARRVAELTARRCWGSTNTSLPAKKL